MRKFSTKKSNEVAKFELNPLNATMRAAVKTGLMARTFRKATPVMVASVAAVGAAVWAPETYSAPVDVIVTSTTLNAAPPDPELTVGSIAEATQSATNVSTGDWSLVPLTRNAITISNNSTFSGSSLQQRKSTINFVDIPGESNNWRAVTLSQLSNWETTFDLGSQTYDSVNVTMAGSGTSTNEAGTSTVTLDGTILGGLYGTSFGAGSDLLKIQNDGTIWDGSGSEAINVKGDGNLIRLVVDNNNLVESKTSPGDLQGAAVYAEGIGQVTVDNSGRILSDYAGVQLYNIGNVSGVGSNATVEILNSGNISGGAGIYIKDVLQTPTQSLTGDVFIRNEVNGVIRGDEGVGISITGVRDGVEIVNNGTISGHGSSADFSGTSTTPEYLLDYISTFIGAGIAIHSGVSSSVDSEEVFITNRGMIRGDRDGATGNGFYGVYATSLGDIELNSSGTIQGDGASAIYLRSSGTRGPGSDVNVTIHADGLVQDELWAEATNLSLQQTAAGRVIVNIGAGNGSASLTIDQGGSVHGAVSISSTGGASSLSNDGTWSVYGTAFTSSSTASITNTGLINVLGTTAMSGIATFENSGGEIDLTADGNATNSVLNITLASDGTFSGAVTDGNSAESLLTVNANLSGNVSSNFSASDRLNILGGKGAIGVTQVQVVDSSPTVAGVNDSVGKIVVYSQGNNTESGEFVLKGGPINKGLWQYDLYGADVSSTAWFLASAPSEHAHELPVMQSAAQEAWHQGAAAWLDHTNNVRMRLEEGNAVKGGAWARIVGADIERKNVNRGTQSYYGTAYSHQNNYEQDIYGVMFGADGAIELANGGTWLLGLTAGVTQSKVNFTTSTTNMDYTAGSVGAYASFVRGGGFFNALLKADMGSTDYKMSNGNGISANESFQTSAFGVMLDGGYRFRSGVAFLEPSISVASVSAKIKDKEFLATNVDFSNGTSLRTKLTLATGFSAAWGGTRFEPYLALSAVHESDGENEVSLTSGGVDTPVQVKDKQVETYGQVGLGLKVVGSKGSSGFLKVEHAPSASDNDTTKGDAKREATTVSAGVKLTW